MRILHFYKTYWPDTFGGIERSIHAISNGTANHGIKSDVLSLSRNPESGNVEFGGHMAHKSKLDFEFGSTGFSRDVIAHFRELATTADIIHYHFPWPMMDIVHMASPPDKPTVVTYHSDIVKQKFLLKLYTPLMHRFLSSVDRIVATSPRYIESSTVLQRYKSKTTTIPLGLDEANYPAATSEEKAKWRSRFPKPFFLFVGVLRYYKGLHILLEAATRIDSDVIIVGNGPMEKDLKRHAATLGLTNIHFVGALSDREKIALLEECIAFVFPSNMRSEAFGLSLVEAAMFGKPMITCEIGTGTSFVNLHGETGLVVKANDDQALACAINRLTHEAIESERFGRAARRRFEENFSGSIMSRAYAEMYQDMISEDKPKELTMPASSSLSRYEKT
ncbi:glycosyltransferase [Pseudomonas fluorescens]|uniref:Glycosyltransferase n=1 Tax=Pseudomonas fluorescens TaxID=294 RepID=A0A944DL67_PSEFL|nr:glycosyltransferase [Pseudomonas fluorescens]MBT2297847.1 glycosyltransferase [Pseudomonas fluorescens]MBT2308138.1 glycosyltransferase [Pseudomonas fluorescens]MBT2315074.1 glycosyltransferase [Pseudomonas fluorescens]MBT2320620.1 glycosyltransferase [Pseudomonas fluorescens]MBT2328759.1 glycosyltransferase [Pseudomonas fluorescens]